MNRNTKSMEHKAEHLARQRFDNDIVRGLRKKRLSGLVKKPAPKKDEQDLGGYDVLESMMNEKK